MPMESFKVDQFIMIHGSKFPPEFILELRDSLERADDRQTPLIMAYPYKSPALALILSIFLGEFGIDRFYVGDVFLGVLKLITGGGCGVWWLVDLFLIMGVARRKNYEKIQQIL